MFFGTITYRWVVNCTQKLTGLFLFINDFFNGLAHNKFLCFGVISLNFHVFIYDLLIQKLFVTWNWWWSNLFPLTIFIHNSSKLLFDRKFWLGYWCEPLKRFVLKLSRLWSVSISLLISLVVHVWISKPDANCPILGSRLSISITNSKCVVLCCEWM